ncbi:MAG: hypothetical protein ACLUMK_06385 [Christensenellales bacterium]
MDDTNVFNAKGKLQEVEALVERFIPSVERMQTQLDQYKVAFTDTTTENAFEEGNCRTSKQTDTAKRGSVRKSSMTRSFERLSGTSQDCRADSA